MEFPLKPDFFPPVRVTHDERQRYVASAEYSVHILHKLVADDKWKRISESKGVTVGKVHCIEEQAYGGNGAGPSTAAARACMILCASVFTTGAVTEVLEAIASPMTEDFRRAMAFVYQERFLDGVCLHTISPRGSRNTQAFTTIKWAAFKDQPTATTPSPNKTNPISAKPASAGLVGTDFCFLEHSGIMPRDANRQSFGFCIQESIQRQAEVPVMAGFGLARGELHRTGILVLPTDRKDVIQIASVLQMDTDSSLSKAALEKLMLRRVSAVARIPLLLDRRRLSRMQFLPRDSWVRDNERRACAVCTKSFGLRRKHHCRNCGEVVCATCAPPREVDVSTYGVAMIRICTACVVQSRAAAAASAVVARSASSTTSGAAQDDQVLVYHVRNTITSQSSHSSDPPAYNNQTHHHDPLAAAPEQYDDTGDHLGDDVSPPPRKSSSGDSNFSISSEEQGLESFDFDHGYDQDDHHGYDPAYGHDEVADEQFSIATESPTGDYNDYNDYNDVKPRSYSAYSDYSEARSSEMSFSDFNTLTDDTLRITSVPPRRTNPMPPSPGPLPPNHPSQTPPPSYASVAATEVAAYVGTVDDHKPEIKHMLYEPPHDLENKRPNHAAAMARGPAAPAEASAASAAPTPPAAISAEYLGEWHTPQRPHKAASQNQTQKSQYPPQHPHQQHQQRQYQEYNDDWLAPPPSRASSASTLTRESMDEWCPPRRPRDRNHSHVSSSSSVASGHSGVSGHSHGHSKRGSSSASSSSSLVDMLASIREIKADLTAARAKRPQYAAASTASTSYDDYGISGKDDASFRPQFHEPVYLERLSEQLRDAELPGSPAARTPLPSPPPPPYPQPSRLRGMQLAAAASSRTGTRSSESPWTFSSQPRSTHNTPAAANVAVAPDMAADVEAFDSDSFSLICPESLLQRQSSATNMSLNNSFVNSFHNSRNNQQGAGEDQRRRSAVRGSTLSSSTVMDDDDVDDLDAHGHGHAQAHGNTAHGAMDQSELLSLRQQVEGLHRSLQDATTKLNYYTARSMVEQQVDSLERDVVETQTVQRERHRHHDHEMHQPHANDPVVAERKQQYHALIGELHEIMGLPALSTPRPQSDELLVKSE